MKAKTKNVIALCGACVLLAGCSAGLKSSVVDHAAVTRVVVEACKSGGVGSPKCEIEDLEAVAKQAECLAATMTGVECEDFR